MARDFCLLILLTCSLFGAENFWFSYRTEIRNKIIIFEERNISPQMQEVNPKDYKYLCKIDTPKKKYQTTEQYLNENFDKLLTCFYSMKTKISNFTLIRTGWISERTLLTVVPIKFTVDFKDDFANIRTIK